MAAERKSAAGSAASRRHTLKPAGRLPRRPGRLSGHRHGRPSGISTGVPGILRSLLTGESSVPSRWWELGTGRWYRRGVDDPWRESPGELRRSGAPKEQLPPHQSLRPPNRRGQTPLESSRLADSPKGQAAVGIPPGAKLSGTDDRG